MKKFPVSNLSQLGVIALALLFSLLFFVACTSGDLSQSVDTPTPLTTATPVTTREDPQVPDGDTSGTSAPDEEGDFDCTDVNGIPAIECQALVALYNSTGGPNWEDSSGWLATKSPCTWAGINCTDGHVSHINLLYNNLTGSLPPEISDLSHLEVLGMWVNQLSGPIPPEMGELSRLVDLDMSGNQLNGSLPDELGDLENLQFLHLNNNELSGSIPASLGQLKSLEMLDLSNNQLAGEIPPEMGDLVNLGRLGLAHNQLSGSIPATFGNLKGLNGLDLSYNQLQGPVPEAINRIAQRALWGNHFDGTFTAAGYDPFPVDYNGVHLAVDPSLADSLWPEVVPATPTQEGEPIWYAAPEHIRFILASPPLVPGRTQMGINLAAEAQILVYPLAELAEIDPWVQEQIEALQTLLAERGPLPAGELPLLPNTNASQMFHAQARYLEFGGIQGLRFISQHSQEARPVNNQELFYTFQGLTGDGAYYVAAFFPLTAAALPDKIEVEDWEAFGAGYADYISETTAALDQLSPADFNPDLDLLDAVVTSLRIEQATASTPNTADDGMVIVEQLPSLPPLHRALDPGVGRIAYQQDKQLWLSEANLSEEPVPITDCVPDFILICTIPPVHWSLDGSRFYYEIYGASEYQLIISDLGGHQQGYRLSDLPLRAPLWSPDGDKIMLFVGTNLPWGDHTNPELSPLEYGFMAEVWQLGVDPSGTWSEPQKLADLELPGIGCGGGGGSISDTLYDAQGGFVLAFEASRQMAWSKDDIIIYPLTCDYWQGYGRFDVQTGQPLAPYEGQLRGLTLDSSGSRWYAVTGHNRDADPANNRLVTGVAGGTDYEVVETSVPVEMVFVGSQSGRLYYTARERYDQKDLSDQIKWNKSVPPYFYFYHSQLWTLLPDGSDERLLWEADAHSLSRLTETPDGDLLFVLIENDVDLYEAVAGGAPEAEWVEHLPRTDIMRLSPGNPEPEIWLENAHNLTAWFPAS